MEWREHAGIRYLAVDYNDLTEEESLAQLRRVAALVEAEPGPVWMVTDIHAFSPSQSWNAESKKLARTVLDPRGVRIALVGLSPFLRLVFAGFRKLGGGRRMIACDSLEEALDAMVRQDAAGS